MPSTYRTALTIGTAIVISALFMNSAAAQSQGTPHQLLRVAANDDLGTPRPLAHADAGKITLLQDRRQLAAKLLSDDAAELNTHLNELNDELAVLRHSVGQALADLGRSYAELIKATDRLTYATDDLQVSAVRANDASFTDSQLEVDDAQIDVDMAQASLDRARLNLADVQQNVASLEQTVGDFEAIYAAERGRVETLVTVLSDDQVKALNRSLDAMAQANVMIDIDSNAIQAIVDADAAPEEIDELLVSFTQEARLAAADKGPMAISGRSSLH